MFQQVGGTAYLVLLEVGLDLRLALGAEGGLIDGQQDHLAVVGQHAAVEAAVHGADILSGELSKLVETLQDSIHTSTLSQN